jgi:hypothetical protein
MRHNMQYLLCTLDYNYIIITQKEMHYCVLMAAPLIAILISFRRSSYQTKSCPSDTSVKDRIYSNVPQ